MISRQVFSFSAAYLLAGEEKYLEVARDGVNYLLEHAWDNQYGGWFDRLTQTGKPKVTTKSAPEQLYTNVGLVLYYFTTGDETVLSYIHKSIEIQHVNARDKEFGGYVQVLNRDLSVRDPGKNKHSHYGYVSSLLLNLFLATRDPELLEWEKELTNLTLERMKDNEGWVHGWPDRFDRQWKLMPAVQNGKEIIAIGAQLTAALSLLRLFHQSGVEKYRQQGTALGDLATRWGFDPERGNWIDFVETRYPHRPVVMGPSGPAGGYFGQDTGQETVAVSWWVQIYGAFLQLQLYRLTGDEQYLRRFETTEAFFNSHFIDKKYGGVFAVVSAEGRRVGDGRKASDWHASYHEIEHGLLNYLYLNLYVQRKPVMLHFKLNGAGAARKHFVSPVDDPTVRIAEVTVNGQPWPEFDARERSVALPAQATLRMRVTLAPNTHTAAKN